MLLQAPSDQHPSQEVVNDIVRAVSSLFLWVQQHAVYLLASSANQRKLLEPRLDVVGMLYTGGLMLYRDAFFIYIFLVL
jgi:hypothetical protein